MSKDKSYVEYALKQSKVLIGVVAYQLRNALPEDVEAMLPEPEEITKKFGIFQNNVW